MKIEKTIKITLSPLLYDLWEQLMQEAGTDANTYVEETLIRHLSRKQRRLDNERARFVRAPLDEFLAPGVDPFAPIPDNDLPKNERRAAINFDTIQKRQRPSHKLDSYLPNKY